MDVEYFRSRLLERERDLAEESAHFDAEARNSRWAEVGDPIDAVISDESKAANFQLGDVAARTLRQVRAALQRIEDGTYGYCIDCGREIDRSRLEAVPWTTYCREDQEKHDGPAASEVDAENA
jgi:DnaK suppressor protein